MAFSYKHPINNRTYYLHQNKEGIYWANDVRDDFLRGDEGFVDWSILTDSKRNLNKFLEENPEATEFQDSLKFIQEIKKI